MLIRFSLMAALCTSLIGIYAVTIMAQSMEKADIRAGMLEQGLLSPVSLNMAPARLDEPGPRSLVPLDLRDGIETINVDEDITKEA